METSLRTMVYEERSTNDPDAIMLARSARCILLCSARGIILCYARGLAKLVNEHKNSLKSKLYPAQLFGAMVE